MPKRACATCNFVFDSRLTKVIECRFNPPMVVPLMSAQGLTGAASLYPPTKLESWCGKWESSTAFLDDTISQYQDISKAN